MKFKGCAIICAILVALMSSCGSAQTYSLSGQLIDAISNHGLVGATIQVAGQTATTDANGNYTVANVPGGAQTINGTLVNYTIPPLAITVTGDATQQNLVGTGISKLLPVIALKARKDTPMLCLDGCKRNEWNVSREAAPTLNEHDRSYCVYTAVTMINRYYHGTISRDECAFRAHNHPSPEGELAHGAGADLQQMLPALLFATHSADNTTAIDFTPNGFNMTEDQYKSYIDSRRPILWECSWNATDGHAMVVAGYRYVDEKFQLQFLNIDNEGTVAWFDKSGPPNGTFMKAEIPPANTVGRLTDPRIWQDADNDGVCDFDEEVRWTTNPANDIPNGGLQAGTFAGLDSHNADTDSDGLPDGKEIEGWLFRGGNDPIGNDPKTGSQADTDKDGVRDEFDTDSDNDGIKDGYEDANHNANVDPGETDPYTADPIATKIVLDPSIVKDKIYVKPNTTTATFTFFHADGTTAWDNDAIEPKSLQVTVTFNTGQAVPLTLQRTGTGSTATWTAVIAIPIGTKGKATFSIKNSYGDANITAGQDFYIDPDSGDPLKQNAN